jgi:hypothetical protein
MSVAKYKTETVEPPYSIRFKPARKPGYLKNIAENGYRTFATRLKQIAAGCD